MSELIKIVDALNRIAHNQEQSLKRLARIEAALDILNHNVGGLR